MKRLALAVLLFALPIAAQAADLEPRVTCASDPDGSGKTIVRFGYVNNTASQITLPVGVLNYFSPEPFDRSQPVTFDPGTHNDVFTVVVPTADAAQLTWTLNTVSVSPTSGSPCAICYCSIGPNGSDGATGAVGTTGAIGVVGLPGPAGDPGPAGVQGVAGAAGPVGVVGPKGSAGPRGVDGPAGVAGAKGIAGPKGPLGDVGPAGPAGAAGPQGPAGTMMGPVGATGAAGAVGDAGPAGVAGVTGPVGPKGPQGDAGAPGVAGARGAPGIRGLAGATGPHGLDGSAGAPGPRGRDGAVTFAGRSWAVIAGQPTSMTVSSPAVLLLLGAVELRASSPSRVSISVDGRATEWSVLVDNRSGWMTYPVSATVAANAGTHAIQLVLPPGVEAGTTSISVLDTPLGANPRRRGVSH